MSPKSQLHEDELADAFAKTAGVFRQTLPTVNAATGREFTTMGKLIVLWHPLLEVEVRITL